MFGVQEEIPAANTPAEVNIHLGYLRRDIQSVQKGIEGLDKKITDLDGHYVTKAEFKPVAEQVAATAAELKLIREWRDTFNGKMIGFSIAISIASAALSFVLNYFLT